MIRILYSVCGKETVFQSTSAQVAIGRPKPGTPCDIDLSPDVKVSRPHSRLWLEDHQYWIEDLNSKHGTKINGEEIKGQGKRQLRAGDSVAVGETILRIERLDESAATADPVEANQPLTLPLELQIGEPAVTIGPTSDAKSQSTFQAQPGASDSERRVALLYELPLRFANESRPEGLLQTIVESLVEVIPGAVRGALLLVDPETGGLVLKAHLPVGQPSVSMTLAQRAVARREGFIWRMNAGDTTRSVLLHGIGTGIYAPLIWREEIVGVVCVDNPNREEMFATEDLRLLMGLGLEDVFRRFEQPAASFSWWDYRAGGFRRNHGLRIDLVLASLQLAASCSGSQIDRVTRAQERASDHAPVLATFDI